MRWSFEVEWRCEAFKFKFKFKFKFSSLELELARRGYPHGGWCMWLVAAAVLHTR